MKKFITSIILVFLMALPCVVSAKEKTNGDVKGSKYAKIQNSKIEIKNIETGKVIATTTFFKLRYFIFSAKMYDSMIKAEKSSRIYIYTKKEWFSEDNVTILIIWVTSNKQPIKKLKLNIPLKNVDVNYKYRDYLTVARYGFPLSLMTILLLLAL